MGELDVVIITTSRYLDKRLYKSLLIRWPVLLGVQNQLELMWLYAGKRLACDPARFRYQGGFASHMKALLSPRW
jgi:hypothetical protein